MEAYVKTIKLTAAEVQTLNSVPVIVIPAPGADKAIVFDKAFFAYEYDTAAFGGIAAGEDLSFNYGAAGGPVVAGLETTGFLDQTANETRLVYPNDGVAGATAMDTLDGNPTIENEALYLSLLSGDITLGGSSTLQVTVWFYVINIV